MMPASRKRHVLLQDRDLRILIFLWKWKVVSNAALTSARFFPKTSPVTAYNRLMRLKRDGLITSRIEERMQRYFWTLTAKGFRAIRRYLPALREEGFGCEYIAHDFLVTALHIGDWLVDKPEGVTLFSEQELRRCAPEAYPSWVPSAELHRPDGYFGFANGSITTAVAIEVELNQKRISTYEGLGEYYAEQPNVARVLWAVPSLSTARNIQKKISDANTARDKIHNFILADDLEQHGWASNIVLGPEVKASVLTFLTSMTHRKAIEPSSNSLGHLFLDSKKSYVRAQFWPKASMTH